ncbi:hypothetical protein niasHT_015739 [Heterodera trifolii]|uniref:K Homology domain-containing protein n=1 Tax=Heterodera trifolii TaxID=157864 RepID=A0ABD2L4M0_9BILA
MLLVNANGKLTIFSPPSSTIMSKFEGGFSSHDSYGYGQMPSAFPSIGGAAPSAPPFGFSGAPFGSHAFGGDIPSPLDAEIQIVLREIQSEVHQLENSGEYGEQLKNARRLLATEATKLENNIDPEWLEVDINKPIKVSKKVLIPSFRHPKFNFVGKVLGPKGTTLQNIAKSYKCHVYILGRGSTRDRTKEQEMLTSGDPQYAHYGGPLHVKVETTAPPAVAYQRVAGVLAVLAELLQPVKDTHIEGITTEPNPNLNALEGGGDSDGGGDSNGAEGNGGEAGGPMKGSSSGGFKSAGAPHVRGGSFMRGGRGGSGPPGGRGGMANRGGFGSGRGRGTPGGSRGGGSRGGGQRGFQPY